ncbi:MAG: hypothetical protein CL834_05165 [Crocinitomicaceae bacterium]|nr:hypothetical protein [Crocinitomicaceae bacterium]
MKNAGILILTLFLPLLAWTQFDRIDVEEVDNGGAVSGKTFRIYAVMQNEGDVIDAVFGEEGKPLKISSTAPFYQHPKGSGLASEVQRFDIQNDAALAYDSWVTIGLEDNYMNSLTGFLIDLTDFEAGNALTTSNGAWFVTPDKRQALAPEDKRILLGQFTTSGVVTGLLNIHGRTKAVLDVEGNVESGAQLIQAENIRFTCGE